MDQPAESDLNLYTYYLVPELISLTVSYLATFL